MCPAPGHGEDRHAGTVGGHGTAVKPLAVRHTITGTPSSSAAAQTPAAIASSTLAPVLPWWW
jgi:hypothetical protein